MLQAGSTFAERKDVEKDFKAMEESLLRMFRPDDNVFPSQAIGSIHSPFIQQVFTERLYCAGHCFKYHRYSDEQQQNSCHCYTCILVREENKQINTQYSIWPYRRKMK